MGLKRTVRNTLCWSLASGLILLGYIKRTRQKALRDNAIISFYFHNPNRNLFRKLVAWFKDNGYTIISYDELIDIINKKIACPGGAVWISLDDGWKENLDNVIPVVVEYNIPVTFYICTDAVENGMFWWTKAKASSRLLPRELRKAEALRRLPEQQRKQIINQLNQLTPPDAYEREAMTVDDVRYISSLPQVTIGSHTISHPVLPNCTDSEIDYEMGESKKKLEDWTGKPVKSFSYPNGAFNGNERQFLEKHGYELAVTDEGRFADLNDDCYLFPRADIMDDGSFAENLCHALNVWEPVIKRFKRIIKLGR